ncbi:MAG: LysE family transporter, partial [Chlorobi bacterium]|nr:LysE family transporter [Chlorobiota bacterium]
IQVTVVILLLAIGAFLFFKKQTQKKPKNRKLMQSKYITGFFLGILNPPVLIYWIVAIGMINDNNLMLSLHSSLSVLFLFFFGIYLGKILTLYLYSRFSLLLKHRVQNISLILNKVTGVLLIFIGLIQAVKLYAF